jgi:DNA-binding XRE family transcriptional regulator
MADLNELSAKEIGRRLRIARENADIRQDDAAQVIGMSRPTLVSIEKGVRRVRIQEIQMLARHYGVSVNALAHRRGSHDRALGADGMRRRDRRIGPGRFS